MEVRPTQLTIMVSKIIKGR